jgi:hypothetical protein
MGCGTRRIPGYRQPRDVFRTISSCCNVDKLRGTIAHECAVHRFDNNHNVDAKILAIITPGILGPNYFREMAAVLAASAGGPRDPKARHGLTPAPCRESSAARATPVIAPWRPGVATSAN